MFIVWEEAFSPSFSISAEYLLNQGVELGSSAAQPGRCCVLDYARISEGERAAAGPVCSGSLQESPSAHCVLSSVVVEAGGETGETHGHRWHPRRLAEPDRRWTMTQVPAKMAVGCAGKGRILEEALGSA